MPEKRHMRECDCVTTEQIKCAGMTHRLLNLPIMPKVTVYEGNLVGFEIEPLTKLQ